MKDKKKERKKERKKNKKQLSLFAKRDDNAGSVALLSASFGCARCV